MLPFTFDVEPVLPRDGLLPPPRYDANLFTDDTLETPVAYVPLPAGSGTVTKALLSSDIVRVTLVLELVPPFWSYAEMDMIRNIEIKYIATALRMPIHEVTQDVITSKSPLVWNNLPIHKEWYNKVKDYTHLLTSREYYERVILYGHPHATMDIFSDGVQWPNSLTMLVSAYSSNMLKIGVFYSIVGTIAMRAWLTINGRYYYYSPKSTTVYNRQYPQYIVRVHPHQEFRLNNYGSKSAAGSCFSTNHTDCMCTLEKLSYVARVTTISDFIYLTMARIFKAHREVFPTESKFIAELEHLAKDKTSKQWMLWMTTNKWDNHPMPTLYQSYTTACKSVFKDDRGTFDKLPRKPYRDRSKEGCWLSKIEINNNAVDRRMAYYYTPSFFGHLYADPDQPTLRAVLPTATLIDRWYTPAMDMVRFAGGRDSKDIDVATKQLAIPELTIGTTATAAVGTKRRKSTKPAGETKALRSLVKQSILDHQHKISCVEMRYCRYSRTQLMPPPCLSRDNKTKIIGSNEHNELSVSWITPSYVVWCYSTCTDLFAGVAGQPESKDKWCYQVSTHPVDGSIQYLPGVYIQQPRLSHHRYMLSMFLGNLPLQLYDVYRALCVIGTRYDDVICTLMRFYLKDEAVANHENSTRMIRELTNEIQQHEVELDRIINKSSISRAITKRARSEAGHVNTLIGIGRNNLTKNDTAWVPTNKPGLGLITMEHLRACLPDLDWKSDKVKADAVLLSAIAGHLSHEDSAWLASPEGTAVVAVSGGITLLQAIERESRYWYRELWYPLLSAARLMDIKPYIKSFDRDGVLTDYMKSVPVSDPLLEAAAAQHQATATFITQNAIRLPALFAAADPTNIRIQTMARHLITTLQDSKDSNGIVPAAKLYLAHGHPTVVSPMVADKTSRFNACVVDLASYINSGMKTTPIDATMLKRFVYMLSTDTQYQATDGKDSTHRRVADVLEHVAATSAHNRAIIGICLKTLETQIDSDIVHVLHLTRRARK